MNASLLFALNPPTPPYQGGGAIMSDDTPPLTRGGREGFA